MNSCWIIPILPLREGYLQRLSYLKSKSTITQFWGLPNGKYYLLSYPGSLLILVVWSVHLQSWSVPKCQHFQIHWSLVILERSLFIHLVFIPSPWCSAPMSPALSLTFHQVSKTPDLLTNADLSYKFLCSFWLQYPSLRAYSSQDYHQLMLPGRGKCILTT